MLPRVLDPCKRHSSKERAKLHRCAAMLTGNFGANGQRTIFDFGPVTSREDRSVTPMPAPGERPCGEAIWLTIPADCAGPRPAARLRSLALHTVSRRYSGR